ncbi:MAG: nucleotidyltransferase domain-containing protein [Spirochaetes bacterium]|nr:nucleotidyltransferase domain-containing protein [Spirochaetota bacterium]
MDKKKVIEKLKEYVNLINSKFVLNMVILYGSYAKGNWKEESDIDIAVVVDKIKGDFLTLEATLYKLRRKIDDRIEPILLEKNEDKSGFLEDILKYGEIIYQK